MSLASWWRRFDASRWVHRVLVLQTIAFAWTTTGILFVGFLSGRFAPTVVTALAPGALTALSGWFAAAWSRERAWTWWAVLVLQVGGHLSSAVSLAAGGLSAGDVARLVAGFTGLVLLLHHDSRARIESRPAPARPPTWRLRP